VSFKHAIVVGASSGLGKALVEQLAADGCRVAALGRSYVALREQAFKFPDQVFPIQHDVTEFATVPAAFQHACRQLGGLDLVIYCAGVMPAVGPSEFEFEKDRAMVDVNVLGAIAWLNQAAIRFENTGGGTIVGIGSVAGDRGRRGQPVYNTTKAALATYLEALRNRLSGRGVRVVTIKPGPMDTPMTAGLGLRGAMPASRAAELVLKMARSGGERYLKFAHRVAFYVIKRIPSWLFRRLKV
jgi:decaprenylphospho-beta-D-erythro-pentofuranosid-2-ulose 2-reductase